MPASSIVWVSAFLVYFGFLLWYLPCGRRLSADERAALLARIRAGEHDVEQAATIERFLAEDRGGSFVMVNLLALAEPRAEARRALRAYERRFIGRLLRLAGHPLFIGRGASVRNIEQWGIEASGWDAVALVRYRCRRDLARMIDFSLDGDTRALKHRALARTIAFPVSPWMVSGGPCLVVGLALALLAVLLQRVLA
jgi:hypothetical protein